MSALEGDVDSTADPDCAPLGESKAPRSTPKRRTYSRHGLNTLKSAIRALGPRVIDRRTKKGGGSSRPSGTIC